ncbi:MAG: hypothetical protein EOO81_03655 [Oxalobacteraceae bacterium]|nr:MAG: hypothetical protein EOO81_03655 [Oxalobacteraceae bacterium]
MELPSELTERADSRGNEFAWRPQDFPAIAVKARELGYGCLGGQFQFRAPGATCEMYWLNADPAERMGAESWADYSARSCTQTLDRFKRVVADTDFLAEARRWADVPQLAGPAASPLDYLYFVAYFIRDASVSNNSFKPNPQRGGA